MSNSFSTNTTYIICSQLIHDSVDQSPLIFASSFTTPLFKQKQQNFPHKENIRINPRGRWYTLIPCTYCKKGKVVPLPSIEAHLGERRYSSCSLNLTTRRGCLTPGQRAPGPIVYEAGWAPDPVWMQRLEEKPCASIRDRTPATQSVDRHYTELPLLPYLLYRLELKYKK
jgi:hypothetical protein